MENLVLKRGYYRTPEGKLWHRVVYSEVYGKIPKNWHVHHIDGDRLNNAVENLIALPQDLHRRAHNNSALPPRNILENWVRSIGNPSKKALKKKLKRLERRRIGGYEIEGGMTKAEALAAFLQKKAVLRTEGKTISITT